MNQSVHYRRVIEVELRDDLDSQMALIEGGLRDFHGHEWSEERYAMVLAQARKDIVDDVIANVMVLHRIEIADMEVSTMIDLAWSAKLAFWEDAHVKLRSIFGDTPLWGKLLPILKKHK